MTNNNGTVTSTIDLDPWGGETSRSNNQAFQPRRFTSYERDSNGGDEAMMRRYAGKWQRFVQPDPYDGSYNLANPQSFNRNTYVQNDPVNFVDPTGLTEEEWQKVNCSTRGDFGTGLLDSAFGWQGPCSGGGSNAGDPVGGPRGGVGGPKSAKPDPCTSVNADMGEGGQGWYRYPNKGPKRIDYGQPGVVATMTNLASDWNVKHPNHPLGIGDLSQFGGAFNPMHKQGGHKGGVIVDIRPMRTDGTMSGTNFRSRHYDRALTQELVNDLLALTDHKGSLVEEILFNDTKVQGVRPLNDGGIHDNHLHVQFRNGIGCP